MVAAIELNDRSHQRDETKQRDGFVAEVCQSVGPPLVQNPTHRQYSVNDLRERLLEEVGSQGQISKPNGTDSPSSPDQPLTDEHQDRLSEALENDSDVTQQTETITKKNLSLRVQFIPNLALAVRLHPSRGNAPIHAGRWFAPRHRTSLYLRRHIPKGFRDKG